VEMMARLIETSRQNEAAAKRIALEHSKRESQLYGNHQKEVRKRHEKALQMDNAAHERLLQQQDALKQAELRQKALKKETETKLLERRAQYEQQREAILSRRAAEEAKKDEKIKELRAKQKEMARHLEEFEARRQAEWEAKIRASEDRLFATTSSFSSAVANENQRRRLKLEAEHAEVEARIAMHNEQRSLSAREHASRHSEATRRFKQEKLAHDAVRAESFKLEAIDKQARLDALSARQQVRATELHRQLRDEFGTKSQLEHLRWQSSIKKSPPLVVRTGLSSIKGMP